MGCDGRIFLKKTGSGHTIEDEPCFRCYRCGKRVYAEDVRLGVHDDCIDEWNDEPCLKVNIEGDYGGR
jgi:hypothetical protein